MSDLRFEDAPTGALQAVEDDKTARDRSNSDRYFWLLPGRDTVQIQTLNVRSGR